MAKKEFTPMIVVIEAQATGNAKEILQSEPFILCPRRNEPDLIEAYEQRKVELSSASFYLREKAKPAIPQGVSSQIHQLDHRANPPQPTQPFDELDALFIDPTDPFNFMNEWDPLDFTRSRFVN